MQRQIMMLRQMMVVTIMMRMMILATLLVVLWITDDYVQKTATVDHAKTPSTSHNWCLPRISKCTSAWNTNYFSTGVRED